VQLGKQLVVQGACAGCHTINGTNARGITGPNLGHFGRRRTVVAWILDHAGEPEAAADTSSRRGLHSPRLSGSMGSERAPARYVLPAGALN